MSQNKDNKFMFWKTLSEMLITREFEYVNSSKYNIEFSFIVSEIYKLLIQNRINESLCTYFQRNNEKRKALIYEVLEDMLFDDDFDDSLTFSTAKNKEIIEVSLSILSLQLTHNDFKFPSDNDYSKEIESFESKNMNKQSKDSFKIQDSKQFINTMHNITYNNIVSRGFEIWTDYKDSKLYCRINPFEDGKRITKVELTDYLFSSFAFDIEVYNNIKDVKEINSNYLVISLLPVVKMEIFDPFSNIEFPYIINNMFYKNKFQCTKYLNNRSKQITSTKESIIIDFIRVLSKDADQFSYIMFWLSFYFKSLIKSNDALVIIGDKEASEDIFVNRIIKPIFAKKNKYFVKINDELFESKEPIEKILNEKIFYHISEVSKKNNIKKVSEIARKILVHQSKNYLEVLEQGEIYTFGQLIVTAEKINPYPFLKDIYSRCVVFGVNKLNYILNELNMDTITLEEAISNDLDNFIDKLLEIDISKNITSYRNTREKQLLFEGKLSKITSVDIPDYMIKDFIDCIKNHKRNKYRFDLIEKESPDLYAELMHSFEENMIARQLLSTYFNIMNEEEAFTSNEELLKRLKQLDSFFDQDINSNKQYKRKKRYTLPEQVDVTKLVIRKKRRLRRYVKPSIDYSKNYSIQKKEQLESRNIIRKVRKRRIVSLPIKPNMNKQNFQKSKQKKLQKTKRLFKSK